MECVRSYQDIETPLSAEEEYWESVYRGLVQQYDPEECSGTEASYREYCRYCRKRVKEMQREADENGGILEDDEIEDDDE